MIEQLLLRMPTELKNILRERAKRQGLTINALVLQILWEWAERAGDNEVNEQVQS